MNIDIHGDRFSNLDEFYDEIENQLTKNLDWKVGRNLDSFNDILAGGFGVHEYGEIIEINWTNSKKSKADLGLTETIKYIESKLKSCDPKNRQGIINDLELAKKGQGDTLFDIIIKIIKSHDHIVLQIND